MKRDDYLIPAALLFAIGVIIIILAQQTDKINTLEKNVESLQHRLELIEGYNFNHSKIE
jgi:hypothetical protein